MKRTLKLSATELEKLLKSWAVDNELLADSEFTVEFSVISGSVTSVTLVCESDDLPE